MKNLMKLKQKINRVFTCITGFSRTYDDCVKAEIECQEMLYELLQETHREENLFMPASFSFSKEEIEFFQKLYTPGVYGLECPYYLGCSNELNHKYKELHDKISSFLHDSR